MRKYRDCNSEKITILLKINKKYIYKIKNINNPNI